MIRLPIKAEYIDTDTINELHHLHLPRAHVLVYQNKFRDVHLSPTQRISLHLGLVRSQQPPAPPTAEAVPRS